MNRRSFVGAGLTGAALSTTALPAPKAGDIPTRVFGKTGARITMIGQAGGRFPMISFDEAKAVTLRAVELGVTYFDNARVYWDGRSEEVYGAVLPPHRKNLFLTSKSMSRDRVAATADLETSLRTMKTDYLDLWQIHAVSTKQEVDQIFAPGGAIEAFEAAKKAGKCRFFGFTGHRDPEVHLEMLKRYQGYDTILMPINPADPAYLSFEKMVLPVAVERGMGIQAMKSTANSKLLHSLTVKQCISYVLSLPVHGLALGCTTIGQIEDDVRIASAFQKLGDGDLSSIRATAAKFKGPGLEDWKKDTERASLYTYRGC
ncbi:MAG: aldo/keto reductase [Bryobacteraceae bacterium]